MLWLFNVTMSCLYCATHANPIIFVLCHWGVGNSRNKQHTRARRGSLHSRRGKRGWRTLSSSNGSSPQELPV